LLRFVVRRILTSLAILLCAVVFDRVRASDTASRELLLDGAVVGGNQIIVVGERGAILRSADSGRTWQAAASPTRATLTAVTFAFLTAPRLGWAVGHDAQILATTDAGATWTKQFQGENLQDSFLDVIALDAQRVIAVGAYGLFLVTTDGGKTWKRQKITPDDYHFNRISRGSSGTLYLAGEHGTLLRSGDAGATWTSIAAPYDGSFYGILPLAGRTLLAHGLRGRIFLSNDDGGSWRLIATPSEGLLACAVKLKSNYVLFAGQARTMFLSRDGQTVTTVFEPPGSAIAEMLEMPDGNLLTLGEMGATVIELGRVAPHAMEPAQRVP
jgi:photosystem II stability/assembly factor-like uncharacterized protein